MTQAWIVRQNQRQILMTELKRLLYEIEDENEKRAIDFALSRIVLDFLERGHIDPTEEPAGKFFRLTVLPKVSGLTRGLEERNALLADFLEYVVMSAMAEYRHALQRVEIMNPRKIFHAKSATSEVSGNLVFALPGL